MRNKILFIAMLLLALVMVFPAAAQDQTVFCGNLATADCELLTANAEAQKSLNSATIALSGELNIVGIPDTPDMTIKLDGKGGYNVDRTALDTLMASMTPGSTPDAKAMVNALMTVLKSFDGELTLTIVLPDALAKQANLPVSTIVLDAKFVDGIGYLNFDELDKVAGGALAAQNLKGWLGINFAELADKVATENSAMIDQMGATMAGSSSMMMNPADVEFIKKYVTIARTDSGSGDAEFTTSVDLTGLFADPEFQALMQKQSSGDDSNAQQQMMVMSMIGQGLKVNAVTRINPDTKQTTHVGVDVNFDLSSIMAMSGQAASGKSSIALNLNIDYSGHNETTVTAPEGAQVAPTDMVLGMLMGGSK
jgi:hypothetical protein